MAVEDTQTAGGPHAATPAARPSTRSIPAPLVAMQHRDFRLLWAGRIVASFGAQMQIVAIGWHIYAMTGSTLSLGLIGVFRAGPAVLFSLAGGALADAIDRRRLLLVTQPLLLLTALGLALSTATNFVSVPLIYAFVFISAAAQALDNPARQAIVPGLVPREHLTNAYSWDITGMQVASLAGPVVGGFAIARYGLAATYSMNTVAVVAIILALVLMRTRIAPGGRRPGIDAVVEGLHFLRRHQIALPVMLLDFCAMFFGSAVGLLPVFARDILQVGAEGLGWLFSAQAIGGAIGALVMMTLGNTRRPGLPLLLSVAAFGVCSGAFGLSRHFWVSMALLAGAGMADTVSMVMRRSIVQLSTPDELRGRVTAANSIFVISGPQLGQLQMGAIAAWRGPTVAVVLGGAGAVLAAAVVGLAVPAIRRYRI